MFLGSLKPNIMSDFASNLRFQRRRFFCVLTSQGHSDLFFQARSTICINLNCTKADMLPVKFHWNRPSSFRGDVENRGPRTDGHTPHHAISSRGLWPEEQGQYHHFPNVIYLFKLFIVTVVILNTGSDHQTQNLLIITQGPPTPNSIQIHSVVSWV